MSDTNTPAPACACDMRTRLVGDGCDVCNPPANTPAPAWELGPGTAGCRIGPFRVEVYRRGDGTWQGAALFSHVGTVRLYQSDRFPTAPTAARAAVAALRAIVGPVAAQLENVPDLDGDAP